MTDQLAEFKRMLERGGDADNWPPTAIRELVAEVERLQRFEAMFEDCARHRDQAERRARRYMDIVRAIESIIAPDEDESHGN